MLEDRNVKMIALFLGDILLINIAYFIGIYIRFLSIPNEYIDNYLRYMPLVIMVYIISFYFFKMYKSLWKNAGFNEIINGVSACTISILFNLIIRVLMPFKPSVVVTVTSGIFITIFVIISRLNFKIFKIFSIKKNIQLSLSKEKVLIIGAGEAATLIIEDIIKQNPIKYNIVGVVDDNKQKLGTYLRGFKILGNRNNIDNIVAKEEIDLILIAIPSLQGDDKKELVEICQNTGKKVKIIPGIYELIGTDINLKTMRNIDVKDLLGREEITLDKDGIRDYILGKVVLVTGGGGSIGSELCRQIAEFSPKKLLILDIYENNAYDLENELTRKYPDLEKDVLIASVRDRKRIDRIFEKYRPQVVFHAAAHKHVPLMEFNSEEAIKNNVVGTLNVAKSADFYKVERFVLISTDKAVNPTNVMGATKRLCEMIIQGMNKISKTDFVAVRFGNVLGSNGSVIPLFKKQIEEGGPVTLTNKYITRYFMLIPEAAQLVLQAGAFARGGEIFVLDMGKSVKIYDLAKNLIRLSGFEPYKDIDIKITGLRPGEKLYEELLMDEEGLINTNHEKIFIGKAKNFDINYLERAIKRLLDIANDGDNEKLKEELKIVVPTYMPNVLDYTMHMDNNE